MAKDRDQEAAASAAAAGHHQSSQQQNQSKRPALHHHHRSDDSHNSDNTHHHAQHQIRAKGKHHVVARAHGRVPSSKALHKHQAPHPARPPHKRGTSSPDIVASAERQDKASAAGPSTHRRSTSEVKLPRHSSQGSLAKTASQSSIKRNKSHAEILSKRSKSSDKLKRTSSGTGINRGNKTTKSQVHFDLGDDPEDEWVDASGSNSPYLSRKGSIVSSGPSSRAADSAANSRPQTPSEPAPLSSLERERLDHKEYLTSRLLQRTPSQGVPPQMTPNLARGASSAQLTPSSSGAEVDRSQSTVSTFVGSTGEGVTSRFMGDAGSGLTPSGSFFQPSQATERRRDDALRGSRSAVNLSRPGADAEEEEQLTPEPSDSALMPRAARRASRAPPAETSRIQQKLNLQRASSVIEPGQRSNPLIGLGSGRGYDGSTGRDPRMSKLLERTGMEYLVVRRYQNPIARSLNRLSKQQGVQIQNPKSQARPSSSATTGVHKRLNDESQQPSKQHMRNVSMPESRRPMTPNSSRRPGTSASRGLASGQQNPREEWQDDSSRMSGATIDGAGDDDGTATLLRNLWEKSMDLSTSAD